MHTIPIVTYGAICMQPLKEAKPTLEQVKEWYSRAMLDDINIFDGQNKIIAILAKALLEEWEGKQEA